ncbi:hypothetical protein CGH71_22870 [Vibrio parahaemolyticus]|uniref:hypothetical protein n=1 Tax=Vibrio parahaemolyticus TaxID=670 RepID=UPI00111E44FE|nr:hypothetical protein [Vibrio parahaemolyticus]TOM68627.1 hypothetical protein CGH71_22870 [Vibrio parahaemolyticus]HAS6506101.1 hypothetical protein [Vibrio parahaemolyticus]
MKRVEQFESLLRKMDVVVTCLAVLTVAVGIFLTVSYGIQIGVGALVSGVMLWFAKFFICGISYTLIQIAKNTAPKAEDEYT